jgi:hypothetical protein
LYRVPYGTAMRAFLLEDQDEQECASSPAVAAAGRKVEHLACHRQAP